MGIVCKGFATSTRLVARAEGLAHIRTVELPPPNIAVQNPEELRECAGKVVDEVIAANPGPVADYKAGKASALNFLKGQVMKLSKGKANPALAGEILEKKLA